MKARAKVSFSTGRTVSQHDNVGEPMHDNVGEITPQAEALQGSCSDRLWSPGLGLKKAVA